MSVQDGLIFFNQSSGGTIKHLFSVIFFFLLIIIAPSCFYFPEYLSPCVQPAVEVGVRLCKTRAAEFCCEFDGCCCQRT